MTDYTNYWNTIIGDTRTPDQTVAEFNLVQDGLDEWLGTAEEEAVGAGALTWDEVAAWSDHHQTALDELREASLEAQREREWTPVLDRLTVAVETWCAASPQGPEEGNAAVEIRDTLSYARVLGIDGGTIREAFKAGVDTDAVDIGEARDYFDVR